ncbi:MAG: 50S ribosomal protein L32 [Cyanobacteria bacterium]|nr:50S ribosomal protein L32 [Cyanobacteriota bacterium]
MPVPKKRLGHSDQGHRRSQWKAILPTVAFCPHCGGEKLPHTVCRHCGFYKDRIVSAKLHEHHEHE